MVEVGRGGTEQARFERDAITESIATRLKELDVGDATLCFGRIDFAEHDDGEFEVYSGERFYIGRISVSDAEQNPLVIDWRAPVAAAFYRATGLHPMGLAQRRYFISRANRLVGIEDERFGSDLASLGVAGPSQALLAALEAPRAGRLGDIVGTIQVEQDEIIRAPLSGVLVVQGGPGTGKTVVALHRAAYLLYTHRFPLEGQGVLVVGPNRLFLGYIELVLPSLGEAGVELAILADLVDGVRIRGGDKPLTATTKGDLRMVEVLEAAVADRERPLREDLVVGLGVRFLRFTVEDSRRLIADTRRRFGRHNAGRRFLEARFFEALTDSSSAELEVADVRAQLRDTIEVREALEWMWPVLTPAHLLHDLFGSKALLRSAGRGLLSRAEADSLHRPRSTHADDVVFTAPDGPLLDEAFAILGPKPGRKDRDDVRTYGHIVVDEAQDLSPMALRLLGRRSLSGSMTIVGDIAQSTGAWPHDDWDEVLTHLHHRREPRTIELTVGYRTPGPIAALAARVLTEAAPQLTAPAAVRVDGDEPRFERTSTEDLTATVVRVAREEQVVVAPGHVAIIAPNSMVERLAEAMTSAGMSFGIANRNGLEQPLTLVPVSEVKGLELDATVVVEPAAMVEEEPQGMRSLYVAVTRATRRLSIVSARPLPAPLQP